MLSGITGSRYGYILLCHNRPYGTDRLAVGVKLHGTAMIVANGFLKSLKWQLKHSKMNILCEKAAIML
jgi:hypothetical protein